MARRRSRSQLDAMDQINVTPLLDLTFLLLIVFMISMPLMQYGLDVTPPSMNGNSLPENHQYNVGLNSAGEIVYRDVVVTKEALLRALSDVAHRDPDAVVLISGDKARPYGDVIDLFRTVRSSGIGNIQLVTVAE